jgi:hypothetical protein
MIRSPFDTPDLQDEPTNTFSDGNTWIDGGGVGTSEAWIREECSGARRTAERLIALQSGSTRRGCRGLFRA